METSIWPVIMNFSHTYKIHVKHIWMFLLFLSINIQFLISNKKTTTHHWEMILIYHCIIIVTINDIFILKYRYLRKFSDFVLLQIEFLQVYKESKLQRQTGQLVIGDMEFLQPQQSTHLHWKFCQLVGVHREMLQTGKSSCRKTEVGVRTLDYMFNTVYQNSINDNSQLSHH